MTMRVIAACLSCAESRLKETELLQQYPALASILLEVTLATALAEAYTRTWDSIFWKTSKTATKRRIQATLNWIAYAIADHVEKAKQEWNEFVDEVGEDALQQDSRASMYQGFYTSLNLADRDLQTNYGDKIQSRQLSLFKPL